MAENDGLEKLRERAKELTEAVKRNDPVATKAAVKKFDEEIGHGEK